MNREEIPTMRKLSLILALLLAVSLCVPTLAETVPAAEEAVPIAESATALTYAEVDAWAQAMLTRASLEETRNDPSASHSEDGYAYEYDFGTLYLSTPSITADTKVLSAEIASMDVPGPHGTTVYMFAQEVMACYAMTNTTLTGSRQSAAAYVEGNLDDGLRWGCVYRDGQRLQAIEYAMVEPSPDGYLFAGVSYSMYENMVMSIHVYGMGQPISEDEAVNLASMVEGIRGESSYKQVPSSYKGSELAMFDEADLTFGGVDLHTIKPEQLALQLGSVLEDDWIEDVNGEYLRVMNYAQCGLILKYDSNKQNPQLDTISITEDGMEGPRCLRIGDSLTSVRNRFRYGEGSFDEETMTETLYQLEGENAPCGYANYSMSGIVVLNYEAPMEDGRTATLMLTFEQMYLTDLMLVLQ